MRTLPKLLMCLFLVSQGLSLTACQNHDPIRIGFIGGLSNRSSDTGQSGLNGVLLAVEQFNRMGGLNGRLLEVISKDDAQNKETASAAAQELVATNNIEGVIGPFSSSMAEAVVPVLGAAQIFEISPTITSMAFYGKDDNLFRINRTTRDNAQDYAKVMAKLGQKRVGITYDLRNRSFTESWLEEFRRAMQAQGGEVVAAVAYESSDNTDYANIVKSLLANKPNSLLFISPAVDVARFAREARVQAPSLPLASSEWASTEQLIKLGGSVVEGLLIVQNFDHEHATEPRYLAFAEAYQQRFKLPPSYSAICAYDAATVLLTALKNRRPNETVKAAALRAGPYQGLQQQIVFDANGDTNRRVSFTTIQNGKYVKLAL